MTRFLARAWLFCVACAILSGFGWLGYWDHAFLWLYAMVAFLAATALAFSVAFDE